MAVSGSADVAVLIGEREPRVLVVGDAILDTWLSGGARRVSREAPVPVVEVTDRHPVPGGAANAAAGLAALGARVRMLAVVGDDADGAELRDELERGGVDVSGVTTRDGATVSKQRVRCDGTVLARWDRVPAAMAREQAEALAERLATTLEDDPPDAVIVGDYGAGGVPDEVIEVLREREPLLLVDAHDLRRWAGSRPDVVVPNAAEAADLLGVTLPTGPDRVERVRAERARLLERSRAGIVVVTLDRDGALLLSRDDEHRAAAHPVAENRTCGAGDVFAAALTAALSCDIEPRAALRFAQDAAGSAIHANEENGTVRLHPGALRALVAPAKPAPLTAAELADVVAEHHRAGRRVVFTNGCFDVLHRGHVAYLEQARRLGDVLVVALNSDASVARLKGPDRPVNPVTDRASVVAALRCVDHVVVFDEDTPISLIEQLRPEVYAKGGDYTPQMLPETPVVQRLGGEVRVLDYLSDHSTSAIVRRIRAS
jgi:rfaE bifunctional protein nucleotidyltransferase chain/domain/rfaE bifunctional protein kinase chain/domain